MTGWEVQAAYEAECAAIWEELNAPDPCEKEMQSAAVDMKAAIDLMDKAEDQLCGAISELSGTPMEDVVTAFFNQLTDLRIDLRVLAEKYERGYRG